MIVIGFSGKAEVGKTTVSNEVIKYLKVKADIIPLAKRMKEQAKMLGWDGKKDQRGRRLLQEISWPVKHYFGEDIYAKWCYEAAVKENLDVLLIDDVRMLAEVDYFKSLEEAKEIEKFILIRIGRPKHISKLTAEQKNDISETQLDNYRFNYVVSNNSTPEHIGKVVTALIENEIK